MRRDGTKPLRSFIQKQTDEVSVNFLEIDGQDSGLAQKLN